MPISGSAQRLSELRTGPKPGSGGSEALSPLGSDYSDGPRRCRHCHRRLPCLPHLAGAAPADPCLKRLKLAPCWHLHPLPCRLVADPDSPTSRLLERAAQRSLASSASAKNTPEKFSYMKDIARNPELARAARRALSSSPDVAGSGAGGGAAGRGPGGGGGGGSLQPLQSAPELDSLTAVVDQLDRDAEQESRINQQMASVMLGRLQSGRSAAERALGVMQVLRLVPRCCRCRCQLLLALVALRLQRRFGAAGRYLLLPAAVHPTRCSPPAGVRRRGGRLCSSHGLGRQAEPVQRC